MKKTLMTVFYTIIAVICGLLVLFFSIGTIISVLTSDKFGIVLFIILAILFSIPLVSCIINLVRLKNNTQDISETRPQNDSKIDNYLSDYSDTATKSNDFILNNSNINENQISDTEKNSNDILSNNDNQSSSADVNISNSELLLLKIDSISTSGIYFEKVACMLLKANGFQNVRSTKASNDYGIDILAEKDDITYAIQCKCYSSSVGNKAVQEAYSGKGVYNCMVAVVLTNNKFTKQAIETAKATHVLLWDRTKLIEMINSLSEEHLKSLINDSLVSNNQ